MQLKNINAASSVEIGTNFTDKIFTNPLISPTSI